MHLPSAFNILIAFSATLGSITYGYSNAILGNTLTKSGFYAYMKLDLEQPGLAHADTIMAVWNAMLYSGAIIAMWTCPLISDKFGRTAVMRLGAAIGVVGAALQAASVSTTMLIIARFVVGAAMGILAGTVPIYQAEISPPANRGLLVGLHGSMVGFGNVIAAWIGVGMYHAEGEISWRVPLGIQGIFPLALFCITFALPESPRWLYMHDRAEEAERVLLRLHKRADDPTNEFARSEIYLMTKQIEYEKSVHVPALQALKTKSVQKRFWVGFIAIWSTQVSGVIVVLSYQSSVYEGLGFSPFMAGVLGGVWCLMNFIGNFIGGFLGDFIGRKRQMVIGLASVMFFLIALCVSKKVGNYSADLAGTIFTFIIALTYAMFIECPAVVYCAELYPSQWRAWGVSTSISISFIGQLIFSAAAPTALRTMGPYFYVIFISLSAIQIVIAILYFPNTQGFTLEQMSAIFGDDVVDMTGTVESASDFLKARPDADHLNIEVAFDTVEAARKHNMLEGGL